MEYDIVLKYLIDNFPEQFTLFITGKNCKVDVILDSELPKITKRTTDKLILVTEPDGEKYILHLEAQSSYEAMVGRMIEYAGQILKKYKLKILPVVLYLREEDFPKDFQNTYISVIHNEEYLRFKFIPAKPWEKSYKYLLDFHLYGLYPLAPLMHLDGKKVEDVLKDCISDLEHLKDDALRSEIYTSIGIIATIKYPYEIISRILEVSRMQESALYQEIYKKGIEEGIEKVARGESALYQEIYKKGIEEGIKEGIEEGIKEGIEEGIKEGIEEGIKEGKKEGVKEGTLKGKQEALILLLEERFGKVSPLLKTAIFTITKDKDLSILFKEVVKSKNIQTFQTFIEKKILDNKKRNSKRKNKNQVGN